MVPTSGTPFGGLLDTFFSFEDRISFPSLILLSNTGKPSKEKETLLPTEIFF